MHRVSQGYRTHKHLRGTPTPRLPDLLLWGRGSENHRQSWAASGCPPQTPQPFPGQTEAWREKGITRHGQQGTVASGALARFPSLVPDSCPGTHELQFPGFPQGPTFSFHQSLLEGVWESGCKLVAPICIQASHGDLCGHALPPASVRASGV